MQGKYKLATQVGRIQPCIYLLHYEIYNSITVNAVIRPDRPCTVKGNDMRCTGTGDYCYLLFSNGRERVGLF